MTDSTILYPATRVQLGPLGYTRELCSSRGLHLAAYFWPAAAKKGVVVLIHGHGEYVAYSFLNRDREERRTYRGSWVEALNEVGWCVCGFDQPGCGLSEHLMGHSSYVEAFDHIVDDVGLLLALIRRDPKWGALPVFLVGNSLGGCIAFHAALEFDHQVAGVALLSPMLSLERVSRAGLNPLLRPLAWLLSVLFPTARIARPQRNRMFPELQLEWAEDPFTDKGLVRARLANEYLRASERAASAAAALGTHPRDRRSIRCSALSSFAEGSHGPFPDPLPGPAQRGRQPDRPRGQPAALRAGTDPGQDLGVSCRGWIAR